MLRKDAIIFDNFWSGREDVCLGFNNGYFSGYEAVKDYYDATYENIDKISKLIRNLFPEKLGDKSDKDIYGAGYFESKPMQNPVIEIAGDRKSAKGLWYSHGSIADITPSGPVSYWTWGCFAADFVNENDEWRIWHLEYLEDIKSPVGQSWGMPENDMPELPEFALIKELKWPEPNVKKILKTPYSSDRPFSPLPEVPVPYNTFEDTFSYGLKKEGE